MDRSRQLAAEVGETLSSRAETIAVAESSTGGLVGSLLTDIPGSSAYFDRSLVTYSNQAKSDLLGVSQTTIADHGAVSTETAIEMAVGVCDRSGTDWGISTTGVAGPGGGTERNPVGTIVIGVARARNESKTQVEVTRYQFDGDRLENKRQFATQALTDLQTELAERNPTSMSD